MSRRRTRRSRSSSRRRRAEPNVSYAGEPQPSERLKPSLLDRLSDDEPGEQREGPWQRFASVKQLRESVVRDLGWLLNCVRLSSVQDLSAHPYAARSVLNFGLPDL